MRLMTSVKASLNVKAFIAVQSEHPQRQGEKYPGMESVINHTLKASVLP